MRLLNSWFNTGKSSMFVQQKSRLGLCQSELSTEDSVDTVEFAFNSYIKCF